MYFPHAIFCSLPSLETEKCGCFLKEIRQVKYYKVILTATGKKAKCPLFRYVDSKAHRAHEQTDSTRFQKMKLY